MGRMPCRRCTCQVANSGMLLQPGQGGPRGMTQTARRDVPAGRELYLPSAWGLLTHPPMAPLFRQSRDASERLMTRPPMAPRDQGQPSPPPPPSEGAPPVATGEVA
eukprot:7954724-Pyramimonas_sp.AAC.1